MPKTPRSQRSAMLVDVQRSGLSAGDAKRLGLTSLTSAAAKKLTRFDSAGYVIPYFNIRGQRTKFYRVRFFDPPTPFGRKKPQKYWQESNTLPQLYFAPLVKWEKIARDPAIPLLITEGEKKAACACKRGLPCVGLGGVWSWRSKKAELPVLPEFKDITWRGREVTVVFDSDVAQKPEVQRALVALSRELIKLGANVQVTQLPGDEETKVGLDDYLVEHGVKRFKELGAEPALGGLGSELWELNNELAYVESSDAVYQFKTRQFINRTSLTTLTYAHRTAISYDEGKPKQINVAGEWLKWPWRRTHNKITYAPGEPLVTESNELNIWPGWGVQSTKGKTDLLAELVQHLFKHSPEHMRWFWQWMAYPLQHPGTKLYTAVVLFSLGTGIGKSLIGLTLGRIYGQNFSEISQEQLHSNFNDWAAEKQFILGDDVTGTDRRRDADLLKVLITRETITVNKKYQPPYVLPDRANYLLTTNRPDSFIVDKEDRRLFIHEVPSEPLPREFYNKYDRWYRSEAGAAAIFDHLLKIDLAGFEPRAQAPLTAAKTDMVALSRSDLDTWAHLLAEDPDGVLRVDGKPVKRALWTASELLAIFDPGNERKLHLNTLAKSLRRAGIKPLDVTNTIDGPKLLYAVRDRIRWASAPHHERAAQYLKDRQAKQAGQQAKF